MTATVDHSRNQYGVVTAASLNAVEDLAGMEKRA
jgi:hypothetical protein